MAASTGRQFVATESAAAAVGPQSQPPTTAAECPICRHHFSGSDARFCPFDGEPLVPSSNWNPSANPLLGTVIDKRYEVLEVLGEGGMGTVYRVRHVALGRQFALKALRRDMAVDPELAARFIQEAKAAAAVVHPGVVQITDFGNLPSGQPYFVMELLQGRPLSWVLHSGGPLPAARAVQLLMRVAEALAAAHEAGVIHRDLKPDNIHVAEVAGDRDVVKVLDFGLAKVAGASRLTRAGMVFGTPHYMSPEQAAGEQVDQRSDIYALGIVMYEVFTGHVPFEADSYMGVLTKHMYVEPTRPSEIVPDNKALGALEDILLRCLKKRPAERYASMAELVAAFESVITFTEQGTVELRPSTRREPAKVLRLADQLEVPSSAELRAAVPQPIAGGRRKLAVILVAAVGLLAAAVAAGQLWSKRPTSASSGTVMASSAPVPAAVPQALPAQNPGAERAAAGPELASSAEAAPAEPARPKARPAPPAKAERSERPRQPVRPAQDKKASARSLEGSEIIDPWAQ